MPRNVKPRNAKPPLLKVGYRTHDDTRTRVHHPRWYGDQFEVVSTREFEIFKALAEKMQVLEFVDFNEYRDEE